MSEEIIILSFTTVLLELSQTLSDKAQKLEKMAAKVGLAPDTHYNKLWACMAEASDPVGHHMKL